MNHNFMVHSEENVYNFTLTKKWKEWKWLFLIKCQFRWKPSVVLRVDEAFGPKFSAEVSGLLIPRFCRVPRVSLFFKVLSWLDLWSLPCPGCFLCTSSQVWVCQLPFFRCILSLSQGSLSLPSSHGEALQLCLVGSDIEHRSWQPTRGWLERRRRSWEVTMFYKKLCWKNSRPWSCPLPPCV